MRGIEGMFSEDEGRWYARFARALVAKLRDLAIKLGAKVLGKT